MIKSEFISTSWYSALNLEFNVIIIFFLEYETDYDDKENDYDGYDDDFCDDLKDCI